MVTVAWPPEVDAGDGVVLRGPDPADAEGMVEAIASSLDELRPWMAWAAEPMTVDQQAVRMALASEQFALGADAHYTIVVDGEIGGSIGMHDRLGDPAAREIGYWRRTGFGGRGVVTRAVGAVVAVLAGQGFERVEIHCDAGNAPSASVAERAGFTLLRIEDDTERDAPASTMRTMVWERWLVSPPA